MGSKILEDFAKQKPSPQVTDPKLGEEKPPEDDGSQEASDRCGLESGRYAVPGLVLIETSTKRPIGISYVAIQNSIRWQEPCGLEFVFEDDRGMWRVEIIGGGGKVELINGKMTTCDELMELLLMRLIGQKRELLRANGSFVKEIRITQVEEEEEDG